MAKAASTYRTFEQISQRLDEIIGQVRKKDVSLERSLDLFDEALELGSAAVELVDATDFTPEEEALMSELPTGPALESLSPADGAGVAEAEEAGDGAPSSA